VRNFIFLIKFWPIYWVLLYLREVSCLRLMTSAGWNDVLDSLMIQPPDCDQNKNNLPNGDCGQPILAITYFVSFIIINYMIVINMYIAIILENFNQAHQEEEIGIVEDDLEMFYIRWSK
jgi:voltage-gated cation channel